MFRPTAMRIDRTRCVHCELCYAVAPIVRNTPERIPITSETLEAMATCPVGAIVWCEVQSIPLERKGYEAARRKTPRSP